MSDTITGILKNVGRGQFAIRTVERSYRAGPVEMMVQSDLTRRFRLTEGALVTGQVERKKGKPRLASIESVGGMAPEAFGKPPRVPDPVPLDPDGRRGRPGACATRTEGRETLAAGT